MPPDLEQLLNERVGFNYFVDSQFRHELYTGIVEEVKTHRLYGPQARIQPDAGQRFDLPARWVAWHQIKGYVPAVEEIVQPVIVAGIEKAAA